MRKLVLVCVWSVPFVTFSTSVKADSVGDAIDAGVIAHSVTSPNVLPLDRTDVAIGESVDCWIEDANDWDEVDESGTTNDVEDELGDVTWSVSGTGTGFPMVLDIGDTMNLYIDLASSNGSVVVDADVDDEYAYSDDAAVAAQTLSLMRLVPSSVSVIDKDDFDESNPAPSAPFEADPNGSIMWAGTAFLVQVQPTNVDWSNVPFRENISAQTFDLPNVEIPWPAKIQTWSAAYGIAEFPRGTNRMFRGMAIDAVFGPTASLQDFRMNVECTVCHTEFNPGDMWPGTWVMSLEVDQQFKHGPGVNDWMDFHSGTHDRTFYPNAPNEGKAQVAWDSTQGAIMGPWSSKAP